MITKERHCFMLQNDLNEVIKTLALLATKDHN